jgi:elongation factor G
MGIALGKLMDEDPLPRQRHELASDHRGWASCTGSAGRRLLREHRVDANVGRPQVAYRETITQSARHAVQSVRWRGMYGDVELLPSRERGVQFSGNRRWRRTARYASAVETGVREAIEAASGNYPIVDVKVRPWTARTRVDSNKRLGGRLATGV